MRIRCSRVLITGGGSGIGKAVARRFLADGLKVTLLGRHQEKLDAARTELNNENVFTLQGDVSKVKEIPGYLEAAANMMGGLDGLVNNAGILLPSERGWEPWDITEQEWDQMIGINLKGAFFFMRDAVDFMLASGVKRGNVLNISSNASCMDITGPYGVSKLSLLKLTRALAKRFAPSGIIINGIAPGATATPIIRHYCRDENAPYARHAIGRFIKPGEIAELAAYLMSDFGEIICGHTVVADGGDQSAIL